MRPVTPVVGGDPQGEPGAVVEPGQDLGVEARSVVGAGESVVGEVGLPGLVGLGGFEADVGGLGAFLRFRDDQASSGQVSGDGGPGHGEVVVVGQVPGDGLRAGVQALLGQFLAEPHDQVHDLRWGRVRVGGGPAGAGFEDGLALAAVAGEQLIEPGLRDAIGGGDFTDRTVLDHHGGDQQSGRCHLRTLAAGRESVRDLSRHHSGMSRDTSPGCPEPAHLRGPQ